MQRTDILSQSAVGGVALPGVILASAEPLSPEAEPETPAGWARYYAAHGCHVFPVFEVMQTSDGIFRCACKAGLDCPDKGKHPRTEHGFHDATADEDQIRRWWGQWPKANIGIRTGDGHLVLDVDVDKGGDESLDVLEAKFGKLPQTRQAITGSGGRHHWFRLPDDIKLGCSNGFEYGLDTRGDGGYVVAEPSVHKSGNVYRWDGIAGFNEPVAKIPQWLLQLLISQAGQERRRTLAADRHHCESPSRVVSGTPGLSGDRRGAVEAVELAPDRIYQPEDWPTELQQV